HAVVEVDDAKTGDGDITYPPRIASHVRVEVGGHDTEPGHVTRQIALAITVVPRFESDTALRTQGEPVCLNFHALAVRTSPYHYCVAWRGGVHGSLDRITGMNEVRVRDRRDGRYQGQPPDQASCR